MRTGKRKALSRQVNKTLEKAVNQFSKGCFDESWSILAQLDSLDLPDKEKKNFIRF